MSKQVPFHIKSGLPFSKIVSVTLPNGRDYWIDETEFEILCQIREASDWESPLLLDLTDHLTIEFSAPDSVEITLTMTGAETRLLKQSGFYDMVISDLLAIDAKATVLVEGPVHRTSVVTSDTKVV